MQEGPEEGLVRKEVPPLEGPEGLSTGLRMISKETGRTGTAGGGVVDTPCNVNAMSFLLTSCFHAVKTSAEIFCINSPSSSLVTQYGNLWIMHRLATHHYL